MAADRPAKVEIPITAMLDMSFQMLIFFIMNFNPSDLEGQMDMALPARVEPPAAGEGVRVEGNNEAMLPPELTILARTAHDGTNQAALSQLVVRDRTGDNPVPNLEKLTAYLAGARDGLSNKDEVLIEADSGLAWARVVEVMDAARKAGFAPGFGTPPDLPGQ
jgi:biopolymer transport protein ExbD